MTLRGHILAVLAHRPAGHMFASVCNIQANVPPENIVLPFDTALEHTLL